MGTFILKTIESATQEVSHTRSFLTMLKLQGAYTFAENDTLELRHSSR